MDTYFSGWRQSKHGFYSGGRIQVEWIAIHFYTLRFVPGLTVFAATVHIKQVLEKVKAKYVVQT